MSHPITRVLRVHRLADGTVLDGGDWSAGGFLARCARLLRVPGRRARRAPRRPRPARRDAAGRRRSGAARAARALGRDERPPSRRAARAAPDGGRHLPPAAGRGVGRPPHALLPEPEGPAAHRRRRRGRRDAGAHGAVGARDPRARRRDRARVEADRDRRRRRRVRGAVAVDRTNLVREVRAPFVISTYPVWENFELIDARRFPRRLRRGRRRARALPRRSDRLARGLRRLPTVRATGQPDDHPGWNRFLLGPARRAPLRRRLPHPVAHEPSRRAAREASPLVGDGALLRRRHDRRARRGRRRARTSTWRSRISAATTPTSTTASSGARTTTSPAPQSMSWSWAPVKRHALTVPGIDGLLARVGDARGAGGHRRSSARTPDAPPRMRRARALISGESRAPSPSSGLVGARVRWRRRRDAQPS